MIAVKCEGFAIQIMKRKRHVPPLWDAKVVPPPVLTVEGSGPIPKPER